MRMKPNPLGHLPASRLQTQWGKGVRLFFGLFWLSLTALAQSPPVINRQPVSITNNAGRVAAFFVNASGTTPLSYQWSKNGANLPGGTKPLLLLSNVLARDEGNYFVVITHAADSTTSAVATLTVIDPAIYTQPVSQVRNPGESVTFSVAGFGTLPLSYQWRKDGVPQAGATQSSLTLTNIREGDKGSYDAMVTNLLGRSTRSVPAMLTVNLALADSFNPGLNSHADYVLSLAIQADGKILVGGRFTSLGGESRANIGRLNADGTLDESFNPGADDNVDSLAVQPDGQILVGGRFTMLAGQSRTNIGRLNADGTLDTSFDPEVGETFPLSVDSVVVQTDGKILVGGNFTRLAGQSRTNIGRLNADGSLDTSFNSGAEAATVNSLMVQVDGKILVAGNFLTLFGQSPRAVARLYPDGTLDKGFNPRSDNSVHSLAVQPDGKILVGGYFTQLDGQTRNYFGRLNADGTLDSSFDPGANYCVESIALQADGKILAGGYLTKMGGQICNRIGRLNVNGTLDPSYNPGPNSGFEDVLSLAMQADGKILVGGQFTTLGGQSRANIGRLNNIGAAPQSLTFDGLTLTWTRGGTSPEVWRTTFEASRDGASWTDLGAGLRISGGWQLTGIVLPTNMTFRVRGYNAGGYRNGSGWFAETLLPSLTIYPALYFINGQFGFSAGGAAGKVMVVESSPDLRIWTPIQTNTLGAAPLSFIDPQSTLLPSRFYRLQSGP